MPRSRSARRLGGNPNLAPRAVLLSCVLASALSLSPGVHAQSEAEIQQARTLYSQGLTQEAASDWAGALASFEKVARIRMTPQVRFHIARSKENLGRLNEALGGYRLAEHEAQSTEGVPESVLVEVRQARESLEKRVPRLIIERGEGVDSAKIALDGVDLGQAQIGREVNVDPGPHLLRVTLADGRKFEKTVQIKEGERSQVLLDVPPDIQPLATGDEETGAGGSEDVGPTDGGVASSAGSGPMPWIVGGIGVASLAASGVFFVLRNSANDDLEAGCIKDVCPDTLEDTQSRGENYSMLSGVTLGIGVVGVVVSAIWLLSGSDSAPATARALPKRDVRFDVGFATGPRFGLSGSF